jgi:hypothetical protein
LAVMVRNALMLTRRGNGTYKEHASPPLPC